MQNINSAKFGEFVDFIRRRENIRIQKLVGKPRPWTLDPILNKFKFTNVWRQDDAVTQEIQNCLKAYSNWKDQILNLFILRIINNIEGIGKTPIAWHDKPFTMPDVKFGDAFIVLPALTKGTKKHDAITDLVRMLQTRLAKASKPLTTKEFHELVKMPRIKGLILYEMTCDWWQLTGHEEDYCNVGTGAKPSLIELFDGYRLVTEEHVRYLTGLLAPQFSHPQWGAFTMRCTEGMLCEWRKYRNLLLDPKARKRYYVK